MIERQATYPDQVGVRPLTIDEVARIVLGRIKTAFAPVGDIDHAETQRKAEWVVNGIEKWGTTESGRDTSAAVDGAESPSGPQGHHEAVGERQGRQPALTESPATEDTAYQRGGRAGYLPRGRG